MHPSASHLIALLSTLLLGCAASEQSTPPSDAVDGLGAESIDTTAFSSVAAQCTCYVDIKVGKAHGIVVRSRDEALSDVKVEVEDDTLKLQFLPSSIEHLQPRPKGARTRPSRAVCPPRPPPSPRPSHRARSRPSPSPRCRRSPRGTACTPTAL